MELFISKLIGSIIQILVFAILPFFWWLFTARKKCSFFQWIGLWKGNTGKEPKLFLWTAGIFAAFLVVSVFILLLVRGTATAASEFTGLGVQALPSILVYAFFHTSLPEEILFRGFLLKRLSGKFGFLVGNTVQALLFGLLHGVMFFSLVNPVTAVLIILFTGGIAWCMGWLNEKKAGGSLLPSWMIHGLSNTFSGICAAFSIL
ncbi:MAG: CPBP family intramembrane metalloprotease [Roseburia sp.]|nr:CPBP family intramembrane metalloprotease [Roseburia sp.]